MSGFDLNKTKDDSLSVVVNYLPIGLQSIFRDEQNQYITADCATSANSNITYTDNNVTTEFKANKLWILGNANNTKLNVINGIEQNAQLVIRNMNSNGDKILFMCFPLVVKNPGPVRGAIDSIVRATLDNVNQLTVNLNDDIYRNSTGGTNFVQYNSDLGNNANVLVYGKALEIISVNVLTLENNLTSLFNLQPSNYNIIGSPEPGEWMECDYVPIDSDEVAAYNLPLSSGLVQDNAANNAMKTTIMFILFIIFAVVAFNIIPVSYVFILQFVFKFLDKTTPQEQKGMMVRFNQVMLGVFGIVASIFLYIGIFGNPNTYPNYAQYLLIGLIICVVLFITYLILESKKAFSKEWPIDVIQNDMKK